MKVVTPVSHGVLLDVQVRIAEKFCNELMTGSRRHEIPDNMYACGQYFDLPGWPQRGLFGTAAALTVLARAGSNNEAPCDVVPGIVEYIRRRDEFEIASAVERGDLAYWTEKLDFDRLNTFKQSEVLAALTVVQHGVVAADDLRSLITCRITSGRCDDGGGWGFALKPSVESHVLPTARVVHALALNGQDVTSEAAQLCESLMKRSIQSDYPLDAVYMDTYVLHALLASDAISSREARRVQDRHWRLLSSDLVPVREANHDHLDGLKTRYVRVPWQLYLIANAAEVRPLRQYLGQRAQCSLSIVCDQVLSDDDFRYPDSGKYISTRTYSILYECIDQMVGDQSRPARFDMTIGRVLEFLSRPASVTKHLLTWVIGVGALLVSAVSVLDWIRTPSREWADLAPSLVVAAILSVFAVLSSRKRKR